MAICLAMAYAFGAVDIPVQIGPAFVIQAENCAIQAEIGQFTTAALDNAQVVYVATDNTGDKTHGYGQIKFIFPDSIPDGEYVLRVRWKTGVMNASAWAFTLGAQNGTVQEGNFYKSQQHMFYPGHGDGHNNEWLVDELAGPNGLSFKTWPNTKVANYFSVTGIGPGDFYVRLMDTATAEDNYLAVDYFELIPVDIINRSYHFEAESCAILGSTALVDQDGVLVAYNHTPGSGGHLYATGQNTFVFPAPLESGDYIVKMAYYIWSWNPGCGSSFAIIPLGSGSVIEHGVAPSGAWRSFWPSITGNTYAVDELAGPNGMQWPHAAQADYVSILSADANEMAIKFSDECSNTYNSFTIDYFELIPLAGL
ncbi:MAG: hypothetical protein ABIG61_00920 [Planctomycetota bacterium]